MATSWLVCENRTALPMVFLAQSYLVPYSQETASPCRRTHGVTEQC